MKMYDYLVGFTFSADGYLTPCTGSVQISRKKKIKTFEDINQVQQYIVDRSDVKGISKLCISSLFLLGRNKH